MRSGQLTSTMSKALVFASLVTVIASGCKKKPEEKVIPVEVPVVARSTKYNLVQKDQLGISGTVTFTEKSSTETIVDIVLTGADASRHPAHIHDNSAIDNNGAIIVPLTDVENGKSSTVVTALKNGSPISYSQLITLEGYLNVHKSLAELGIIIAQGDIGSNVLTGDKKSYALDTVKRFGVSGEVLFEKRKNGNTLATISLINTLKGASHPAHIHIGSLTTAGQIVVSFNPVDGTTGKSFTNLTKKDEGTKLTYDEILVFTGYVNVHQSSTDLGTILTRGDIGRNKQ